MMRIGTKIICGNFLCTNTTKKSHAYPRNNCEEISLTHIVFKPRLSKMFLATLCSRRGCMGYKRTPECFDLVKIRAHSLEILAKSREIWWIKCEILCEIIGCALIWNKSCPKSDADVLFNFGGDFWIFLGRVWGNSVKFGEIGAKLSLICFDLKKLRQKSNADAFFFLGDNFVDFFRTSLQNLGAKILRTSEHLPARTLALLANKMHYEKSCCSY